MSRLTDMRGTDPGDRILVARARLGDAAALEALVRKYARLAFAAALSVLANHADAEDVCQDAWARALERIEDCRDPDRFGSWLLRIVRNRALNYAQYRKVRATEPLATAFGPEGPPGADDPSGRLRQGRLRDTLGRAIGELSPGQREVLLLHDLAGWRHRAIAELLGISEVMSRQHLFQARARLRKLLGEPPQGGAP